MINKCLIVLLCIAGLALAGKPNKKHTKTSTERTVKITEHVSPKTRSALPYVVPVNPYASARDFYASSSAYPVPVAYSNAASYSNAPIYHNAPGNVNVPGYPTGPVAYATAGSAYHSGSGVQYVAVPVVPYATGAPASAYGTAAPFAAYSTPSPIAVYSPQPAAYSTAAPFAAYSTTSPIAAYSTPAPPTYVVSSTIAPPTVGRQSGGPIITTYSTSPEESQPASHAVSYKSDKTYKNPPSNVRVAPTGSPVAYSVAAVTPAPIGEHPYDSVPSPVPAYALDDGQGNVVPHPSFRQAYTAAPVAYYPVPAAHAGSPGLVNPYQIIPVAYSGAANSQGSYTRVGGYPFAPGLAYAPVSNSRVPVGYTISPSVPNTAGAALIPYGALAYSAYGARGPAAYSAGPAVSDNGPYTRFPLK